MTVSFKTIITKQMNPSSIRDEPIIKRTIFTLHSKTLD